MASVCAVCDQPFTETSEDVIVKARGINTLIQCSKKRGDGKHERWLRGETVKLHMSCYKTYTREKCVAAAAMKASTSGLRQVRSGQLGFDFLTRCILCSDNADEAFMNKQKKKEVSKRDTVCNVTTLDLHGKIIRMAVDRKDQWGEEVNLRLANVIDLVASDGRYHRSCMKRFFYKPSVTAIPGRPQLESTIGVIEHISNYMESMEDECQFSLTDILKSYEEEVPSEKIIKMRLQDKYGDGIIIASGKNRETVMCLRQAGHKILSDQWYTSRKSSEEEERARIVASAAAIIREDIRTRQYNLETYPEPHHFLDGCENDIPPSLRLFLDEVIKKRNRGKQGGTNTKVISIAHAIISATRPRSFYSPLHIGLGAFLYRKYGSRDLVDIADRLGFCCSYQEIKIFEISCMRHPQSSPHLGTFSQFVFDNADVNMDTIDGSNTFHAMGGVQCVTPVVLSSSTDTAIVRQKNVPRASVVGEEGAVPIRTFEKAGVSFKNMFFSNLTEKCSTVKPLEEDFQWILGKWRGKRAVQVGMDGWNK